MKIAILALSFAYAVMNLITYLLDRGKPTILFLGDSVTEAKIDYTLWHPYTLSRYAYAYKMPFYHEALYAHGGWCRLVGEKRNFNWYNIHFYSDILRFRKPY